MTEIPSPSRASAQTLLRRLFVAFVLPWAFISAQAASAHIARVPADTTVSATAGTAFVVDVRNGAATIKVERGGAQPGKSAPPIAIVSAAGRSPHDRSLQPAGFLPFQDAATFDSAPSDYWSRGPPRGAPASDNLKSI